MADTSQTNFFEEIYKYVAGPIIGAILAYWFGIRGRQRDIDNLKVKELNTVLSNMLDCWHYLNRLSELLNISEDKTKEFFFPREYLAIIVLQSGTFNDKCFEELESSFVTLKQYDPITYFELEGVGRRFDYVRKNIVLPFLKSEGGNKALASLSRTFLDQLIKDIKEYIRNIATLISSDTVQRVDNKFEIDFENDFNKIKDEYNQQFYATIISAIPEGNKIPTYEEFKTGMQTPEIQKQLKVEFKFILQNGMDKLISITSENPALTLAELEEKINEKP